MLLFAEILQICSLKVYMHKVWIAPAHMCGTLRVALALLCGTERVPLALMCRAQKVTLDLMCGTQRSKCSCRCIQQGCCCCGEHCFGFWVQYKTHKMIIRKRFCDNRFRWTMLSVSKKEIWLLSWDVWAVKISAIEGYVYKSIKIL
jgi:hypothetical protein